MQKTFNVFYPCHVLTFFILQRWYKFRIISNSLNIYISYTKVVNFTDVRRIFAFFHTKFEFFWHIARLPAIDCWEVVNCQRQSACFWSTAYFYPWSCDVRCGELSSVFRVTAAAGLSTRPGRSYPTAAASGSGCSSSSSSRCTVRTRTRHEGKRLRRCVAHYNSFHRTFVPPRAPAPG